MNYETSEPLTIIIGAGVTGLTTAYTLAQQGEPCLLIEKDARVGGQCRSYELDGIIFDLGPHVFFYNPDWQEATGLMFHLFKHDELIRRRFRFAIDVNEHYWRFPVGVWDALRYPLRYKQEMLAALLTRKRGDDYLHPNSLQAMVEKKSGRHFYTDVLGPLSYKKTGIPGDQLHWDWYVRVDRDIHNCRQGPRKAQGKKIIRLARNLLGRFPYYYPARGFEQIPIRLWEAYGRAGGHTLLQYETLSLEQRDNRITTVTVDGTTYPVKQLVWTASINELNRLLEVNIPPIRYLDVVLVFLTYNVAHPRPRPFVYVYHPQDDIIFNRSYYPSNIFQDRDRRREGICLEINDIGNLTGMSPEAIISKTVHDVERLGIFSKHELRQQQLILLKDCLPVYELEYEHTLQQTFEAVQRIDNLHSVGRIGGYFFCLTYSAVSQGLKMAEHLFAA